MAQRGPGKHFRKGISVVEIVQLFPDDAAAERWFAEVRWPDGTHCPHCGSTNVQSGAAHKSMPYRCREQDCGKRFSVRTGTVMEASNIGYQKWAIAFYLFTTSLKGVSSMKLHRDLGITQKSAWFMAHRIRETWAEGGGMFEGPAEADETFFGGKRANMHRAKRRHLKGHGTVGKTPVAGMKDRPTNRVTAKVVDRTDATTLRGFVADHLKQGSQLYTDRNRSYSYRGMPFKHRSVDHKAGEYVRGPVHTNGIESFWATLKRAYKGTFHHLSDKHLDRYLTEFSGRHNDRSLDTIDQIVHMAQGTVGRRLTDRDLIR